MRCATIIKHTPVCSACAGSGKGLFPTTQRGKGKETPINLLGFKDGAANPDKPECEVDAKVVWVTADQQDLRGQSVAAIRQYA